MNNTEKARRFSKETERSTTSHSWDPERNSGSNRFGFGRSSKRTTDREATAEEPNHIWYSASVSYKISAGPLVSSLVVVSACREK